MPQATAGASTFLKSQSKTVFIDFAAGAADADQAQMAFHQFKEAGQILAARVVKNNQAAAGINDANTLVLTVECGADTSSERTVATKTYNTAVTFPSANTVDALTLQRADIAADDLLFVTFTQGTAADHNGFRLEVDYV